MKNMLRISTDKLNNELNALKEAYLRDLSVSGVKIIPENDALAKVCLQLYLRWQENYNNEAERYAKAYEGTKIAISLADEYLKEE